MRVTLLLALFVLLAGCSRTPDEARIRAAIAAMETAVEQRQPRDFMAHVADDFAGQDGAMDRTAVHNLLRAQFLRNAAVNVLTGPIEVTLHDERANARLSVTLTGGSGLLPERGALYDLDTGWKRAGGDWQLISAQWIQR